MASLLGGTGYSFGYVMCSVQKANDVADERRVLDKCSSVCACFCS